MVPALRQQSFFGSVRKGQMPHVMQESRQADCPLPVTFSVRLEFLSDPFLNCVGQPTAEHAVKNAFRDFHHAERMLETLVGRPWIYLVAHGQLMDGTKSLKRRRIDQLFYQVVEF